MVFQQTGTALTMLRASSFIIALFLSATVWAKDITAKSYIVADSVGTVISEKDADHQRPIASITKLMTAIVVLDAGQDLDEQIKLNYKLTNRYKTHLPRSIKTLSRRQLIELAIVKSDNLAAYTLCDNFPYGVANCVQHMNTKAYSLKMTDTFYTDPTGLEDTNVSTARDLVKLVLAAKEYPDVVAATKANVDILVKKHWWSFGNTNPLVRTTDDVTVSKTGFIGASGGCVVMLMNTSLGQRVVALLGSKNTRTRFPEAQKVAND